MSFVSCLERRQGRIIIKTENHTDMKKFILLLLVMLVLWGCSGKSEGPTVEPEPVSPTADPPTDTTGPRVVPDDIIEWLNGDWHIVTADPETNGSVSLSFDAATKTVKISRIDNEYIVAELEAFDSFDDPQISNDALRFKFKEASAFYIDTFGTAEYVYQSDMQYVTGYFEDRDFLFLRELGNGFSVIDSEAMGDFDKMAGDYGWVFVRENTGNTFPTMSENEDLKIKDETFFAYCWGRGDTYLLQKVNVIEQEEEWYEGLVYNTYRIVPAEGEYKYTAFLYDGEKLPEDPRPSQVKVSVSNGAIHDLREYAYVGYGAYTAD